MPGSGPFLAWLAFMHGLTLWFLWPCAHFSDFSTSIFFSKKNFGAFVWGPTLSPKHLSWEWILCWAFKKHDYKEALVTKIARFSRKTNKNMCPCDFSLDFTISRPWIHLLQKRNFHWISHVEAMMWKAEQPTKKSCRNKVSIHTLAWNDAGISGFSASVHSKTIFTRFHNQSAGGEGGLRAQFFRSQSGSKIFIHDVLCHDARTWPISCLACFYAWVDLVIPMALCTLFRLFNFMQEQGVHEHASWNSCMHLRIQCLSSFKNDFHQISYPQCRGVRGV